ncbi:FFD and TFG box motif protein [Dictyocaulus viviparus]|uniref:FFD and TFG box motif protein n=1 Tax=Dictyocaulus viviparus TaxID=29172 RepID=A0A0D8Y989_DICVI|nr:FFD and TFG box motif protein [Dictyocaulus viviparus]
MSNQTPYIGSKISLISKLDIRYEGILYTVDTNDSTIALAKVRSFGTEDRPTPNPVEARDDVYEYIIFKANDIKDLIVCETPKVATLAGGLPYDPAIISVSARTGSASANEQQVSAGSSRSDTPHHRGSPNLPHGNRAPGSGRGAASRGNRGSFAPSGNAVGSGSRQFNSSYPRGGYNYTNQRPRNSHSVGVPRSREKLKFDGDYDFEKANEQFQEQFSDMFKDKLKVDGEKSEEEQAEKTPEDTYYDKKSSFFDRISCEASEKAEGKSGRPDWKKERETNQETFGHSAVRSLNYRRGFGQRGRGGRGYGRPNGGRYINNFNRSYNFRGGHGNENGSHHGRGFNRVGYQQNQQQ